MLFLVTILGFDHIGKINGYNELGEEIIFDVVKINREKFNSDKKINLQNFF